ncbi:MAG: MFS transporter [Elusimicrobia bacterium]|nr:MFS transporter [Elusimicrobiota bacterium]
MIPAYWKEKRLWGWAMYDFANSAFATTTLAVIFNVYFVQKVVPAEGWRIFGVAVPGAALWGYTVSLSMFITFFLSPLLGAAADFSGRKKAFLSVFWVLGFVSAGSLFFVRPGDVGRAMFFFILANVGFAGGNVFYNAFLTDLSRPGLMGRISGLGWALGYIGGGLCLAFNLLLIKLPGAFGIPNEGFLPVRACLLSVGVWWFVFSLPFFRWVPESPARGAADSRLSFKLLFAGWSRLKHTLQHIRDYSNLVKFMAAYLVYNDGIETIILMASIVGAQLLGMKQDELILCFLMIQGVAFAGALLFGWLADRIRHKPVIFITLVIYAAVLFWAYAMDSIREFWALGVVVGLVLGGSQAASRSLMALLTPPEKSAEFFSFYSLVGKLTALFGPLLFGFTSQVWGLRGGVLSLMVFFVVGGALLAFVQEKE